MSNLFLILLQISLLAVFAQGSWKVYHNSTAHPDAISDIEYIVNEFYQELNQTKIEVRELDRNSAPVFLTAITTPDQFPLPPLERHYTININPILYDPYLGCPVEAIFAILVHELAHIDFYIYLSNIDRLMTFVRKYYNPNDSTYKKEWERWTDKKVLYREIRHPKYELAEGLQKFRTWVYNLLVLDDSFLQDKIANYLTPEEIQNWIDEHSDPDEPTEVFDEEIEAMP